MFVERKFKMRKKYISKTYMREVIDWELVIIKKEEENYFLGIKKINKTIKPFKLNIFGKDIVHIDEGYYIVEFTPLDKFYNARVYLDNNKNIIDYYFDISRGNGAEDNVPYYDDLYLDVIYYPNDNEIIEETDEDELINALNEGFITQNDFDLAKRESQQLMEEIKTKQNIFLQIDVKSLVEKYFG